MPQFWIAIFFVLLAIAQLYESVKAIELPLPVYLVLGTVLAIASNAQQKFSLTLNQLPAQVQSPVVNSGQHSASQSLLASAKQQDLHKLNLVD